MSNNLTSLEYVLQSLSQEKKIRTPDLIRENDPHRGLRSLIYDTPFGIDLATQQRHSFYGMEEPEDEMPEILTVQDVLKNYKKRITRSWK